MTMISAPLKLILCAIFVSLMAGCAGSTQDMADVIIPVFPEPPDEPRFYYERTIASSVDVEIESRESVFERFVTGSQRVGIGMIKPFGVAVHQGRVFVSDSISRQVFAFDVPEARFFEIGIRAPGQLAKPMGVDVDAAGNLYVCDATHKQVFMYDRDGHFLKRFGEPAMFDRPAGLTVDPAGQRIFVVDTGGVASDRHQVSVLDTATGNLLRTIARRGDQDGELNLPRDARIAGDGNLYIVDGGNFRVQVFTQQGEFVRSFGEVGRRSGQFSRPKGIGADRDGNIYVADTAFGNFQIFDPQGRLLLAVGNRDSNNGPASFMLPAGLAVDEDGRVYLVDQYFRKVDVFRPASLAVDEGWLVHREKLE
ncbi:MAG: 6-bladed beta-propeller [Gammaproteobacteria bacterium]|nr:6-bladed beta-propeller [Gammaproteobacteria bacterium]